MSVNVNPIFKVKTTSYAKSFASGDTTAKKDLVDNTSGGLNVASGILIEAIYITTNDTTLVDLYFYLYDGTTDFFIGNQRVPVGSGYTTVVRVEALRTLSPDLGFLVVPYGWKLKCACLATMTAAKVLDVVAQGGPYE